MTTGMNAAKVAGAGPDPRGGGGGAGPHGLQRPTVVEWLQQIAAVVGPERALQAWLPAAVATGNHGMSLAPDEMERTGQWLVEHTSDAPLRMAVRSCLVRLRIHRVLAEAAGGDR